jgi:putative membrane protein
MSSQSKIRSSKFKMISPWLDVLALLTWGALLLKYWITGQLKLLIHPNYFGLVFVTSIVLLILGIFRTGQLILKPRNSTLDSTQSETLGHITLLPYSWGSGLLLATALMGLAIAPGVLSSQTALQRGITESLPEVRFQTQTFRATVKPEERSLIDWVRTLNAYPEPEAYAGQKAKVTGFVVHLPQLPDNYFLLCRFVITCCAVDAYPIGIPVKVETSRTAYPPDTWLEIEGEMTPETLPIDNTNLAQTGSDRRQLVISARSLQKIPTPADPYDY